MKKTIFVFILFFFVSYIPIHAENSLEETQKQIHSLMLENTQLNDKIDYLYSTISDLEKRLSSYEVESKMLKSENQVVIKAMDNNLSTITTLITIIGILFGLGTIIITLLSVKSISKFLNFKLNQKISDILLERINFIKDEIVRKLETTLNEKFKDRLQYWDKKFSELDKEVRGR